MLNAAHHYDASSLSMRSSICATPARTLAATITSPTSMPATTVAELITRSKY
jgi:hypothetical protein